jgi:hypothetical protein
MIHEFSQQIWYANQILPYPLIITFLANPVLVINLDPMYKKLIK